MALPAGDELARRVRAAAGYADMSLTEFRKATEISHGTFWRIIGGTHGLKDSEVREMARIADLPEEFFTEDFALLRRQDGAAPDSEVPGAPTRLRRRHTPQGQRGPRKKAEGS